MENIKKLIAAGFRVYLLDIDRGGVLAEESKPEKQEAEDEDLPKVKRTYNKKKEFVERILKRSQKVIKRVNWKTINKIKEFKKDGMTSEECAVSMGLPLETVNKYWVA